MVAAMPVYFWGLMLVGAAAVIIGVATTGIFKKQAAAWIITALMVVAAVFIGLVQSPLNRPAPDVSAPTAAVPSQVSRAPAQPTQPAASSSFVWDEVNVLSDQEVQVLNSRNDRLWERYHVTIGVVVCNYSGDDLYDYAFQCAEDMGLGGYDMIVVLDLLGDNYWLLQGNDINRDFTSDDCTKYAYEYLEYKFARGFYGDALLDLTEALEIWYGNYFG